MAGLKATKPTKGKKVDTTDADSKRYSTFLTGRHNQVAAAVGPRRSGTTPPRSTPSPRICRAGPVQRAQQDAGGGRSDARPTAHRSGDRKPADFLKLSGENRSGSCTRRQCRSRQGRRGRRRRHRHLAGERLAFRDRSWDQAPTAADPYRPYIRHVPSVMHKADGNDFTGAEAGEDFTADVCNTKLISAKYFGDPGSAPPHPRRVPTTPHRATVRATERTLPLLRPAGRWSRRRRWHQLRHRLRCCPCGQDRCLQGTVEGQGRRRPAAILRHPGCDRPGRRGRRRRDQLLGRLDLRVLAHRPGPARLPVRRQRRASSCLPPAATPVRTRRPSTTLALGHHGRRRARWRRTPEQR